MRPAVAVQAANLEIQSGRRPADRQASQAGPAQQHGTAVDHRSGNAGPGGPLDLVIRKSRPDRGACRPGQTDQGNAGRDGPGSTRARQTSRTSLPACDRDASGLTGKHDAHPAIEQVQNSPVSRDLRLAPESVVIEAATQEPVEP